MALRNGRPRTAPQGLADLIRFRSRRRAQTIWIHHADLNRAAPSTIPAAVTTVQTRQRRSCGCGPLAILVWVLISAPTEVMR